MGGTYQNGRFVPTVPIYNEPEYEADLTPKPRCPRCQNYLVQRHSKAGKSFYGCGNYPHCKFTASTELIAEAIRRRLKVNTGK